MSATIVSPKDCFTVLGTALNSANLAGLQVFLLNCADGTQPCAGRFDMHGDPLGDNFEAQVFKNTTFALKLAKQLEHGKITYPLGETVVATTECEMLVPGTKIPPPVTADGLPGPPPSTLPGEFTILSAAAPANVQYDYFGHSPPMPFDKTVISQIERQISMILLWSRGGILITPAWGAGEFLNPPSYMATVWARVIKATPKTSCPSVIVFCMPPSRGDGIVPAGAPPNSGAEWRAFDAFAKNFPATK